MVKRSALSHNAGFDALNCPTMKKTPALTDAEINEIDELLAAAATRQDRKSTRLNSSHT